MTNLSLKLYQLADKKADKNNENPSFRGRSKPEEQVEYQLAKEAAELETLRKAAHDVVDSLSDVEGRVAVVDWAALSKLRDLLEEGGE